MTAANPFQPAEQVTPKIKCLIYGGPGIGKTYLALTAPGKVAVIDTEGGTAFYAKRVGGRGGLSQFDVLPTKTFASVESAVRFLQSDATGYQTLVIDPVTVLYETLQEAAQARRAARRSDPEADLEMLDWQRIKRAYKRLMTDLVNLPLHVIVVARERDDIEGKGDNARRVGFKPDAEKSTAYYFDTVVRLVAGPNGREAIVEKDRTGTHELGARLASPTFTTLFAKAIKSGKEATASRTLQSDDEAARIDAETTFSDQPVPLGPAEKTGTVELRRSSPTDGLLRQNDKGPFIGFALDMGGEKIGQVIAEGDLASALAVANAGDLAALRGVRVTVSGELYRCHFLKEGVNVEFKRLVMDRIETPDWTLPVVIEAPAAEPAAEIPVVPEPPAEAASVPLFPEPVTA